MGFPISFSSRRKHGPSSQRRRSRRTRPLLLEPLEDRVVLTITLIGSEAMATDPAGNIYITGTLGNSDTSGVDGWADFDPGPGQTWVNRAGEFDGFLAKYGADRSLKWVVRLDGPQRQVLTDVAVDVDGSAFVVGTTTGISTFWNGDGSYQTIDSPERATVVAKVSPDGVAQWVDTFKWTGGRGQVNYNATGSIALDGVGHVYADGNVNFGATGDFFGQPVTNSGFVLKLHSTNGLFGDPSESTNPTPGWVAPISFEWVGNEYAGGPNLGLAADATGVYAACADSVNPISLIKLNANGTAAWAKQNTGGGVAIDGTSVYTANGSVTKYVKETGAEQWTKPGGAAAQDLLVQNGKLYLTGNYNGTVDFDPDPAKQFILTGGGNFVWELTDAGAFVWAGNTGGNTGGGTSLGIGVDGSGNVVTAGCFKGSADFDPGPGTVTLSALNNYDAFVSRLTPSSSGSGLVYDQSFPAFQIGSYDRTIGAGSPGYVESGSGWKAWPSGGARYHAKGTGKNTATWTFTDMAASPSAFYDVWVSWPAKSNNASNAKFSVVSGNGTTVYTVNQQVSLPPGGYYLGTFPFPSLGSADGKGQITVVLSDNANGNVVAATVGAMISHPGSPLRAMAPPPGAGAGGILSPAALPALEQEALARWAATGLTSVQLHQLQNLSFQIADLGGTTLGLAVGSTIMVDDNAAGWGWFVDPTPGNDSEFTTPGNQGEQNRMDLLTVLMHEMGHVLGQNHESTGLMAESLAAGERLSPRVVDHCFADKVDWSELAVALAQEEHPNHRS